jgi:hypothetical protein
VTVAVKVTGSPWADGLLFETRVVVVDALLTVWVIGLDVLLWKLASPPYVAVRVWVPTLNPEMVSDPLPLVIVDVPSKIVPSKNETVPVGVPPLGPVTVAVSVTGWPNIEGLTEEVSVVVDVPGLTV